MNWQIHTGSALEVLRALPDASAQCCVTSPPIEQAKQRQFEHILRKGGGIIGVQTAKGPRPFHEVADDPVIARLCAEDNR